MHRKDKCRSRPRGSAAPKQWGVSPASRAIHLGQRMLHGLRRDDEHSLVRRVHIDDQENGAGDCQRSNQQRRHDNRVARREKAEAHEQYKEPEDQDDDEWVLNMR